MKKNRWLAGWLPALMLLLAACGPGEIQPLQFQAPAWGHGEVSEYRVTDVNGNYAGILRFDITRGEAADVWLVRREIDAQGVLEVITVHVAGSGYRPQFADQKRSDSQGSEQVRTTYSGSRVDLELTTRQDITTYERMNIPSDARDEATLLMLVRALPLAGNYATRLNVFTPIRGHLERMTVHVVGRERVETPAGAFDAWRVNIEGRERSRRIQVWIGVDAPYPVVKFIDGRNRGTFEMTGFQPGTE